MPVFAPFKPRLPYAFRFRQFYLCGQRTNAEAAYAIFYDGYAQLWAKCSLQNHTKKQHSMRKVMLGVSEQCKYEQTVLLGVS